MFKLLTFAIEFVPCYLLCYYTIEYHGHTLRFLVVDNSRLRNDCALLWRPFPGNPLAYGGFALVVT